MSKTTAMDLAIAIALIKFSREQALAAAAAAKKAALNKNEN